MENKVMGFIKDKNYDMLIPWFLILSYAYYIKCKSLVKDTTFDLLCKTLKDNFEKADHMHKHLIKLEDLTAGTFYHFKEEDYPNITKGSYLQLIEKYGK